jgi:cell division protein ZapE
MPHQTLGVPQHGMIDRFNAALTERGIVADAAQQHAATRLQVFYDELLAFKAARRSTLRKLLMRPDLPRGVWFWGGVGRGKSFLMDCFFAAVPYQRKRRVHFHSFMGEIHEALKNHRNESDPLALIAKEIATTTRLMCFDEFHVSDIADAMILGRLMEALFAEGVVFCITSNYPPSGLYPNGLQRDRFLPAIAMLTAKLDVIEIDAGIDYRRRELVQNEVFLIPTNATNLGQMDELFERIAGGAGHARLIEIAGRELAVVRRAPGVIWFDFATLCGGPRSQADYLALVAHHHTILLSAIPKLAREQASEARRFTWLIDILYDHRVKFIACSDVAADDIYTDGPQANEFHRTVSRLIEMRSQEYLNSAHRIEAPVADKTEAAEDAAS